VRTPQTDAHDGRNGPRPRFDEIWGRGRSQTHAVSRPLHRKWSGPINAGTQDDRLWSERGTVTLATYGACSRTQGDSRCWGGWPWGPWSAPRNPAVRFAEADRPTAGGRRSDRGQVRAGPGGQNPSCLGVQPGPVQRGMAEQRSIFYPISTRPRSGGRGALVVFVLPLDRPRWPAARQMVRQSARSSRPAGQPCPNKARQDRQRQTTQDGRFLDPHPGSRAGPIPSRAPPKIRTPPSGCEISRRSPHPSPLSRGPARQPTVCGHFRNRRAPIGMEGNGNLWRGARDLVRVRVRHRSPCRDRCGTPTRLWYARS